MCKHRLLRWDSRLRSLAFQVPSPSTSRLQHGSGVTASTTAKYQVHIERVIPPGIDIPNLKTHIAGVRRTWTFSRDSGSVIRTWSFQFRSPPAKPSRRRGRRVRESRCDHSSRGAIFACPCRRRRRRTGLRCRSACGWRTNRGRSPAGTWRHRASRG